MLDALPLASVPELDIFEGVQLKVTMWSSTPILLGPLDKVRIINCTRSPQSQPGNFSFKCTDVSLVAACNTLSNDDAFLAKQETNKPLLLTTRTIFNGEAGIFLETAWQASSVFSKKTQKDISCLQLQFNYATWDPATQEDAPPCLQMNATLWNTDAIIPGPIPDYQWNILMHNGANKIPIVLLVQLEAQTKWSVGYNLKVLGIRTQFMDYLLSPACPRISRASIPRLIKLPPALLPIPHGQQAVNVNILGLHANLNEFHALTHDPATYTTEESILEANLDTVIIFGLKTDQQSPQKKNK